MTGTTDWQLRSNNTTPIRRCLRGTRC